MSCKKTIIYKHFFVYPGQDDLTALDAVTGKFFAALEKYMIALLQKEQPTVLGLSVFRGTLAASLFAFKLAKSWNPALLTVMGGAVFSQCLAPGSPNFEPFLEKTPYIDRLLIGEGEILFLKLLRHELPAGRKYYSLPDIAGEPNREEMFSRVDRFVQRCRELGVPNPYSLQEIYEADQRWRKLHENAVPALVDFEVKGAYIDEARKVKRLLLCRNPFSEEGDFGFLE